MLEAGLVHGLDSTTGESEGEPEAEPTSLTWAGHEFADAARSDTMWNKAKAIVKEKAVGLSLAVLTPLLQSLAKKAIGLPDLH